MHLTALTKETYFKNPYLQNYNPQWSEDAPAPALKYLPRVPLGLKMYSAASTASTAQSHYIEVAQGDIFMEQKM